MVGCSRQSITCESAKTTKKERKLSKRRTTVVSIARENIVAVVRLAYLSITAN